MKIIAFDHFKSGVTMETITPLFPEEAANAWRLLFDPSIDVSEPFDRTGK